MIGSKQRMPKRARYPLFLAGLVVIVLGGLVANAEKASAPDIAGVALVGFAFLVSSVVLK